MKLFKQNSALIFALSCSIFLSSCGGGGGGGSQPDPTPSSNSVSTPAAVSSSLSSLAASSISSIASSSSSISSSSTSNFSSSNSSSSVFSDYTIHSGDQLTLPTGLDTSKLTMNNENFNSGPSYTTYFNYVTNSDLYWLSWSCINCGYKIKFSIDPNTKNLTFTAPSTSGASYILMNFKLSYRSLDSTTKVDKTIVVKVDYKNVAPQAITSSIIESNPGSTISLTGNTSYDEDRQALKYTWEQISGTAVTIPNKTLSNTSIVIPSVQNDVLRFRLTVTDTEGATSSSDKYIVVNGASSPNITLEFPKSGILTKSNTNFTAVGKVSVPSGTLTSLTCDCGSGVVSIPVNSDGSFSKPNISLDAIKTQLLVFEAISSTGAHGKKIVLLDPNYHSEFQGLRLQRSNRLALSENSNELYLATSLADFLSDSTTGILKLDLNTGSRTTISSYGDATKGPVPTVPNFIVADNANGLIYLSTSAQLSNKATESKLFKVDISTGNRTLISSVSSDGSTATVGAGPFIDQLTSMKYSPINKAIYAVEITGKIIKIDVTTGDRSVILSGTNEANARLISLDSTETSLSHYTSSGDIYSYQLSNTTGQSTKVMSIVPTVNGTPFELKNDPKSSAYTLLDSRSFYALDYSGKTVTKLLSHDLTRADSGINNGQGYIFYNGLIEDDTYTTSSWITIIQVSSNTVIGISSY